MIWGGIGLVIFLVFMVIAHKRKMQQSVYIPLCLAAGSSGAVLVMHVYGYYFGVFNLYYFIVTTLLIGLVGDFIIRKTVTQNN